MPNYRESLQQKFQEEYQKLNERQREAVDAIEGPVMVIAGPGTGKTQILASRIGKILLQTDTSPENILCLTYTDSGAVAMRQRLLHFIGPDAYKVNIYTFHSFCNDIIQENLSYFEKNTLDPISDLESIELFRELIDTLPKNNPLKRYRGETYFEAGRIKNLFSDMKKEGWTPEFLNGQIDSYIASLSERDGFIYKKATGNFKKGDLNIRKIEEEKEKMELLRAAINQFSRYQQMMHQHNRYDFDDMINWVIRAFKERPSMLLTYQEKYQYILVDEYQDTSGSQNQLVELISGYWEKPNLFVVGDDDQSIYRFQGANVYNMMHLAEKFQDSLLKVVLVNNYRSTQPILDVAKSIISRNSERLINKMPGLKKELIASNEKIKLLNEPVSIAEYETIEREMAGIAMEVRKLINEGVDPGKIGIIYRENKYGLALSEYFRTVGIPVFSKKNLNLLNVPLIKKIILILRYLNAECNSPFSGDELLFEILHAQWFQIPPIKIAMLSLEVSKINFERKEQTSIRQLLSEKVLSPAKDLFSEQIDPGLAKASQIVESLIGDVSNITLQQLFESIIQKTGILSSILNGAEKHWELTLIRNFLNFIKEETQRNPLLQLSGLVKMLELMGKEKIEIPVIQSFGSENGVNLMTAHKSKGLEFEHVFFVGCNSSVWEKKKGPTNQRFSLPDQILNTGSVSSIEELRRLFYVAITRAEQHLQISYARFDDKGKNMEASQFVAEIQDDHNLITQEITLDEDVVEHFSLLMLNEQLKPEIAHIERKYVDQLLGRFVMNSTALNNYLKCPLEFYFRNLIRIPSPKNENLEFGSAVHYALEQLFRKMLGESPKSTHDDQSERVFPPESDFIGAFNWYMKRHRDSFTEEQFNRRMEYGNEILSNYYKKNINSFHKIVLIEHNIRNAVVDDVPIKGKLDKIEFYGNNVKVVDYKTGSPGKSSNKLKQPDIKQPNGGDYWRQAVFYKILIENYKPQWHVESAEFDFIEPDSKKEYLKAKVSTGPADVETVKQQIHDVWNKIQQHDFYTGCGSPDCHWCNFVKDNSMAIALHQIPQDEEDA